MANNFTAEECAKIHKDNIELANKTIKKKVYRSKRNTKEPLKHYFDIENNNELGIDEAGRGPLFGRVYVAGVIIPKDDTDFKYDIIKDSKRFSSKKKLMDVYNYIKENCIDYYVSYKDEKYIDNNNIRQSVLSGMNECITNIKTKSDYILIDGCDFVNNTGNKELKYKCIEGGDNWYVSIAAASILAKVERDMYIEKLCKDNPELNEKYGICKNKGYGTRQHIEGIKKHGISKYHRKTYGICKNYHQNDN